MLRPCLSRGGGVVVLSPPEVIVGTTLFPRRRSGSFKSMSSTHITTAIAATDMKAVSLKGVTWNAPGGVGFFVNSRTWGVQDSSGRFFSTDGVTPSGWRSKAIATMVLADGILPGSVWVTVRD